MKKQIRIQRDANRTEEREINYIPVRYILALLLAVVDSRFWKAMGKAMVRMALRKTFGSKLRRCSMVSS